VSAVMRSINSQLNKICVVILSDSDLQLSNSVIL
jgi:hypothetical protein